MRRTSAFVAVLAFAASMLLTSCATTTQLYAWGQRSKTGVNVCSSYEASVYEYYKTRTPEAAARLAATYEYMIEHPGGVRKVVPPGICAEYGFFLLQEDTLDALCAADAKKQGVAPSRDGYYRKGLDMLALEMQLYPESRVLVESILKQAKK